jgi:transcriptional regulator of acetoin/glycerol metabolism
MGSADVGQRSYVELTAELRAELRDSGERARPRSEGGSGQAETPQGDISRRDIEAALAKMGGKVTRAARLLGLKNRYALYRLMARHGIGSDDDPDPDEEG